MKTWPRGTLFVSSTYHHMGQMLTTPPLGELPEIAELEEALANASPVAATEPAPDSSSSIPNSQHTRRVLQRMNNQLDFNVYHAWECWKANVSITNSPHRNAIKRDSLSILKRDKKGGGGQKRIVHSALPTLLVPQLSRERPFRSTGSEGTARPSDQEEGGDDEDVEAASAAFYYSTAPTRKDDAQPVAAPLRYVNATTLSDMVMAFAASGSSPRQRESSFAGVVPAEVQEIMLRLLITLPDYANIAFVVNRIGWGRGRQEDLRQVCFGRPESINVGSWHAEFNACGKLSFGRREFNACGTLWVADRRNFRVHRFNQQNQLIKTIGTRLAGEADDATYGPCGVAASLLGSALFVSEFGCHNNRISEYVDLDVCLSALSCSC